MRRALVTALCAWVLATGSQAARAQSPDCLVLLREPTAAVPAAAAAGIAGTAQRLAVGLDDPPRATFPAFRLGSVAAASKRGRAGHLALQRWYVLRFADAGAAGRAVTALRPHPDVEWVEPVGLVGLAEVGRAAPAVPRLAAVPWNVERVRGPEALQLVVPDSTIVIAVIDTGADVTHPDLAVWQNDDPLGNASPADDATDQNGDGRIDAWELDDDDDNGYVDDTHGFDFTDAPGQSTAGDATGRDADVRDENGHGTHVAGIIAARGGTQGVAPFVRIMPVRAAYNTPFGGGVLETDDAAAAIVYAVDNGARILNLSWGDTVESRVIREAISYAAEHGVLVVAAAGNAGGTALHYPSSDPRVIGVASVDRSGRRSTFSNFGPGIELAAPGEEAAFPGAGIVSLAPLDLEPSGLASRRGTSMAAPHVAGAAAIVMSRPDRPDARRVRALLAAGARRHTGADWSSDHGHGELDAAAAVQGNDDLVVTILGGTPVFRRGRLLVVGTVLGADAVRHLVEVRDPAGQIVEQTAWTQGQVVADTLLHIAVAAERSGTWDAIVRASTPAGRVREAHAAFVVDHTPATVDTLFVRAAWRAGMPLWLCGIAAGEPVRARVQIAATSEVVAAHAGMEARLEFQIPAPQPADPAWRVHLENAAGLDTSIALVRPPALPAWPHHADVRQLDATADFVPTDVAGFSAAGRHVVWGRGALADTLTTLQAWGVDVTLLVPRFDAAPRRSRPVAYADANADGSPDLLVQEGLEITWILTRAGYEFPDSVVASVRADRGLGLFQLDADAAHEALLSTADSLYIYDDVQHGALQRLQVLVNPSRQGFNLWGADAAVGDLDHDGRIEIACGDGEGTVVVFERATSARFELEQVVDADGVYAYEFAALPDGGFVVGRQDTRSLTGDGFPSAVYEFRRYAGNASKWQAQESHAFVAPVNALRAGSTAVRSPASGDTWLACVRGADVYLLQPDATDPSLPWRLRSHLEAGDGEAPALGAFGAGGGLQMIVRTPVGAALYALAEDLTGPHSLRARSGGETRIELSWTPGSGASRLLRRGLGESWTVLGETPAGTWVDSTVVPGADSEFEVRDVVAGVERGATARVKARAQPRPRLLGLQPAGSGLRLAFSNGLDAASVVPARFRVRSGDVDHTVLQVLVSGAGRDVELVLDPDLACGAVEVRVADVWDTAGGLLRPQATQLDTVVACATAPFYVVGVEADGADAIAVEFNREPAPLDVVWFTLTLDDVLVVLAGVDAFGTTARLRLALGQELQGRGIPYRLRIDAAVRAAADGAPLAESQSAYAVLVAGSGTPELFVYPNPAPATASEIVFAQAAADTRVRIYNLEGELVRELSGALSGGIRWDLRTRAGGGAPSGVYVYVAQDSRGTKRGRIALLR